ncbi:MAG TPA: ribonuclease HII [Gammaproteobacteria bacterium]|nr:ribonuclease HII [Gammaproteobacteria bacterium]
MAAKAISKLSIEEIRERFARADEPVTPQALNKLKRDPRHGVRQLYEALKKRYERDSAERIRLDAMLNFERVLWRAGVQHIAGVDEVGMGPLAGPVIAAAVIFPPHTELAGIDDSKKLDLEQREEAERRIRAAATAVAIGRAEVDEIDTVNIYHAGLLAMRRAVEALPVRPQHVLVDARSIPGVDVPQNCFNKGDGIDFSIAAASIVAKTHRDRIMDELARAHPEYGFERHKGYCTPEHQDAIRRLGPCAIHRKSFTFIQELRGEYSALFYDLKERIAAAGAAAELQAVDAEVGACCDALAEHEQRKLRLTLSRRWKAL